MGVVAEAEVSGMGPESAGVSDGAVAGGADFLDGRSFFVQRDVANVDG